MASVKVKFKSCMNDRGTPGILKIVRIVLFSLAYFDDFFSFQELVNSLNKCLQMMGKLIFEPDDPKSDSKHQVKSQDIESMYVDLFALHRVIIYNNNNEIHFMMKNLFLRQTIYQRRITSFVQTHQQTGFSVWPFVVKVVSLFVSLVFSHFFGRL